MDFSGEHYLNVEKGLLATAARARKYMGEKLSLRKQILKEFEDSFGELTSASKTLRKGIEGLKAFVDKMPVEQSDEMREALEESIDKLEALEEKLLTDIEETDEHVEFFHEVSNLELEEEEENTIEHILHLLFICRGYAYSDLQEIHACRLRLMLIHADLVNEGKQAASFTNADDAIKYLNEE